MCKDNVWLFTLRVAFTLQEFLHIPQTDACVLPNGLVEASSEKSRSTVHEVLTRTHTHTLQFLFRIDDKTILN